MTAGTPSRRSAACRVTSNFGTKPCFLRSLRINRNAARLSRRLWTAAPSLNNLGLLYEAQKRFAEAEQLFKRALATNEKALGSEHRDVATSLNNLAGLYRADGELDHALAASTRAVEITMKHLFARSAQGSVASIAEQRTDRFYFTNYITFAVEAAQKSPERYPTPGPETFRVGQMAQISNAGAAVAALAARLAAGSGAHGAMIRERQDLVRQWQGLDNALVKILSHAPSDGERAEQAFLRSALEAATRRPRSLGCTNR